MEAVIAGPGFERALRGCVECWLPKSNDTKMIEVTMRDLGRMVSGNWSLYLDSSPGGLTLSRMSKLLEGSWLSSPGRARALLLYLRFLGYIEPAVSQDNDGREKRFRVTPQLKQAFHERYRRDLGAFIETDPAIAEVAERLDDEEVFRCLAWAHGGLLVALLKAYRPETVSLDMFSSRYSGMMVLAHMLLSGEAGDSFPPQRPVRYTVAGLARETGISRAQVRRLFREAQAAGFMTPVEEGLMLLTPLLAEHVKLLVACASRILAASAEATLTHLEESGRDVA
ncbi:AraC-like DNA-binding protein [Caulobacter ginsengisoli]|uniref:AraC-like DNA-binding protein n=1 Tax=Caulobacter ginsengisoli TaxID=400775 RepID=A0ABU0IUD5_9CAUL|nr:hypothetical protein [Caulobacter ginsengisoli]MDQ0464567.1 AraC-like DNA-binding protein [Caulobacter ginsengisoli]